MPGEPRQEESNQNQGDQAKRQVDVEHPSPAEVVGDEATDQRSDDAPQSEDAHDQAHPAATLAGRKDIADGSDAQGHQRASTNAGERSGGDQLAHVLRKTGAGRTEQEDQQAGDVEGPPAKQVGELAHNRHGHRRREHVGREEPGIQIEAVQLADDGRRRGRHDRTGEDRGELHQHDRAQHPIAAIGRNLVGQGCDGPHRGGRAWIGCARQDLKFTDTCHNERQTNGSCQGSARLSGFTGHGNT